MAELGMTIAAVNALAKEFSAEWRTDKMVVIGSRLRTAALELAKLAEDMSTQEAEVDAGLMKFSDYQKLAHCTEAPVTQEMLIRFCDKLVVRLLHAGMGMCTEAGEFQDQLKRFLYYGKPLDCVNLAEEVGDTMWYLALAANALKLDLVDIATKNIEKLRARYPDRFTEHDALNRDLSAERRILE